MFQGNSYCFSTIEKATPIKAWLDVALGTGLIERLVFFGTDRRKESGRTEDETDEHTGNDEEVSIGGIQESDSKSQDGRSHEEGAGFVEGIDDVDIPHDGVLPLMHDEKDNRGKDNDNGIDDGQSQDVIPDSGDGRIAYGIIHDSAESLIGLIDGKILFPLIDEGDESDIGSHILEGFVEIS